MEKKVSLLSKISQKTVEKVKRLCYNMDKGYSKKKKRLYRLLGGTYYGKVGCLLSEGDATMRNLLGGKGANLAEMTNLGLPVPQGFTITTEACTPVLRRRP